MKPITTLIGAIAAAVMLLPVSCCQKNQSQSGAGLDELFATRRSIRSYDATKTISEAEVRTLLEASQQAPSWANRQPSRYYVVLSPDKLAAVRECVGERNAQNVAGAPVLIVSTFVKGQSGFGRGTEAVNEIGDGWGAYDNGLANAYLILKAREMGFDTLIMGYRDSDRIRTLLHIPDSEEVLAVIALGYRNQEPGTPNHFSLDEIVKFF
ncbi:MAG: nitroreductase family protein [Bacteroidales bacterium]|nr:nitroreductase family protein [Bacteroidales bacterium]